MKNIQYNYKVKFILSLIKFFKKKIKLNNREKDIMFEFNANK